MHVDRRRLSTAIGRDATRTVIKHLLTVASLGLLLGVVSLLPGVDRPVPGTPVTFGAVLGALVTVLVVGLLLAAAPRLATVTRLALSGPTDIVENVASVAYWFVVFAAVLVSHRGLAGVVVPFLEEASWIYDIAFLVLALPIVVVLGARLYATVEPGADHLTDAMVEPDTTERSEKST